MCLRIRIIWIREACGGETRCCRLALLYRAIGAIDTIPPAHAVRLQAERRVPAIGLGPSWRGRRQSRDHRKDCQSWNAHLGFLSDRGHCRNPIKSDQLIFPRGQAPLPHSVDTTRLPWPSEHLKRIEKVQAELREMDALASGHEVLD